MKKNQKVFASVILIIVVVIVGYFVIKSKKLVAPESTSSNEMTDWKTYTNTEYGFEFKYPSGWDFINGNGGTMGSAIFEITDCKDLNVTNDCGRLDFMGRDTFTFSETGEKVYAKDLGLEKIGTYNWNVRFSPISSMQVTDYFIKSPVEENYLRFLSQIRSASETGISNQILSTFKFIEPTMQINTSNWKTYTSIQYGFEFQYPANFIIENSPDKNLGIYHNGYWQGDIITGDVGFWRPKDGTDMVEWTRPVRDLSALYDMGHYVDGLSTLHILNNSASGGINGEFYFIKNDRLFQIILNPSESELKPVQLGENLNLGDKSKWYNKLLSTFKFTK